MHCIAILSNWIPGQQQDPHKFLAGLLEKIGTELYPDIQIQLNRQTVAE